MTYREIIRRDALAKSGTQPCSSFAKPLSAPSDPAQASSPRHAQRTGKTNQRSG